MNKDLQAFPCGSKVIGKDCSTGLPVFEMNPGMTLRDYFAAKAMQSLIAVWEPQGHHGCIKDCAVDAYSYADAMLEARK